MSVTPTKFGSTACLVCERRRDAHHESCGSSCGTESESCPPPASERYIKRSSIIQDFIDIMILFHARLRLQGYPEKFLGPVFAATPSYEDRDKYLQPKEPTDVDVHSHCLVLNFSKALESLRLKQILHEQLNLIPKALRDVHI